MLPCAEKAVQEVERMNREKKRRQQFTIDLFEIVKPINLRDLPNPYDEEVFAESHDDGSGLEPHQR